MENKEVISGIIGAGFFAIGYLGLSVAILPSLAIGAGAYVASELVMGNKKKKNINIEKLPLDKKLKVAKDYNKHISDMVKEIESPVVVDHLKNINSTTTKIIKTIEKNKLNNKTSNKFLDYYLPVCVNIIDRYDEIENQDLTSKDSRKFMDNSANMVVETDLAFEKILNNLYQDNIENNEAEMKVYNQMLKSDGYNSVELEVKDGDNSE